MNQVVVQEYQKSLISYVYRLTGCIDEAKDITQETILKYLTYKGEDILNEKAWLFKVATNLTLDFFKSARNKKETYIGPWLPQPYIDEENDSFSLLELDESLSVALLVVMEKLSVNERIAYILHDVFEFKHKEIALLLNTTSSNSRQLTSRANKKLKSKKSPYKPTKEEHTSLTNSFLQALKIGDFQALKEMFTKDVELHSDGGGKAIAARKVLYGDNIFIAKFLLKVVSERFKDKTHKLEIKPYFFNGELGLLLFDNKILQTSYSFEIKDNKIFRIFTHRNPDKLKFFI